MTTKVCTNVCIVNLASPAGGSWHSAIALVETLLRHGTLVRVTMPDGLTAAAATERLPSPAIITFPAFRHGLRRDIALGCSIRRAIRGSNTVVHSNTLSAARASLLAVLFTRKPMVVHLRNSAISRGERVLIRMIRSRRAPCLVVAVSQTASDLIDDHGDVRVIYNPVYPPGARSDRPMSKPAKIGVVVNGRPTKGFDQLIDIAASMRDVPVEYNIFGVSGPSANDFVAKHYRRAQSFGIADRLEFRGRVSSLSETYMSVDAILVVSRRESFGRVAAEAMLAGVPTVIPDVPGLLETTGGEPYVWVYRSGDAADGARALRRVIHDPEAAFERAVHARQAARRFEPNKVACEMNLVYAQLTAASI